MEKLTTITNYVNYKGGVNNLKCVHVMSGFLTLQVFTGDTSTRRAKSFIKKFNKPIIKHGKRTI